MKTIYEIESDRLRFRTFKAEDAKALLEIYSDKEAMKYRRSKPMVSIEDAIHFIVNQKVNRSDATVIRLGVELKEGRQLIGSVMYKYPTDAPNECIIGYSIGGNFWNCGYGREIVKLLVENIEAQENIHTIKAWTIKENVASNKILELNAFEQVPQEEFPKSYLYLKKI